MRGPSGRTAPLLIVNATLFYMAFRPSVVAAGQQVEVVPQLTHLHPERDAELSFEADARLINVDECA